MDCVIVEIDAVRTVAAEKQVEKMHRAVTYYSVRMFCVCTKFGKFLCSDLSSVFSH